MIKYSVSEESYIREIPPDIFEAVRSNDPAHLAYAIQSGQSLDDQSVDLLDMTPIHYACYLGKTRFLNAALTYKFNPWIHDRNGRRAIDIARLANLKTVQRQLLEKMYPNGPDTPCPDQ